MKKFECLFVLCALLLSLGLVGCGGGVEGKPAIKGKDEKPSAEQQKVIDQTKKNMGKQGFGDRDIPNQD